MKSNLAKQLLALSMLLGALSTATFAADDSAPKASSKLQSPKAASTATKTAAAKTPAKAKTKAAPKVVMTGSNIPREIKSTGYVRETTSPVYVVDHTEIERSGAMTTADLLRRLPFIK